jgi:hypothetical protein
MKELLFKALPTHAYLTVRRLNFRWACRDGYRQTQRMRETVTERGHSYKPFDDHEAIFVHVPKCAGVSVSRALFGGIGGGHATLDQYLVIFEPRCIESYFKFTIARNPWDRLVSAYFFLRNGGYADDDRQWFNEELGGYAGFDDFVRGWLSRENIWKWSHFIPQYHYILDRRERVPLDFVGFFENLDADFAHIATKLRVAATLPKHNTSRHDGYQGYYTDETRRIVQEVYAEDIRLLGYRFDNGSLPDQLQRRASGRRYSLHAA